MINKRIYKESEDNPKNLLQNSETLFIKTFHASPDAFIISRSSDGNIIEINRSTEVLFGYSREELIGRTSLNLGLFANPHERERAISILKRDGFLKDFIVTVKRKSGELRYVSLAVETLDPENDNLILTSARDITERTQMQEVINHSEERFRSTLDNMIEGCAIIGFDWTYKYVNKANARHAHLMPENMIGRTMFELIPGVEKSVFYAHYERCMEERTRQQVEAEFAFADGSTAWYEVIAQPVPEGIFVISMDITARKQAEEALRISEEHYHTLFNAIDEGFCVIEMLFDNNEKPVDYRFLEVNPAFEKQSGLVNVVGKRMRELAPKHEEHWFELYGNVAVTGKPVRFQNRAEELNRWFDIYAFRIGKVEERQVAVLFNDITERKKAVEALRTSEAQLDSFFANSPAILNLVDENFCYIYTDKLTPTYYSLNRETIKGKCVQELSPDFIEQTGGVMRRVIETGEPVLDALFQSPVPGRGGEVAYWRTSFFRVPLGDEKWGVGVISVEVTDIKRSEVKIRESEAKLIDAQKLARFGNYTIDVKNNNTIEWSDQMYDLWEVDREKPIPPFEELWNLIHPDDRDRVKKAFDDAAKENRHAEVEFRILFPGNRTKYVNLITRVYLDELGNIIKRQGVEIDITETKVAQMKIEEAYTQLAERLKEKEVLLRELYHRTKNNLQVISSLLSLKVAAFPDSDLQNIIQDLQDRIRAIALVHEKLYRSRNLSRVDLQEYIVDLINLFKVSHSISDSVIFRLNIDPITVQIDTAIPCGLIITELIQNSLKYAFPGERTGYIEIKLKQLQDQSILLVISDNGIGLSESDLTKEDKLGIRLFKDIAEDQLDAVISLNTENGVSWSVQFKDIFHEEAI